MFQGYPVELLQAGGLRPLGGGDRTRRRTARLPALSRVRGRHRGSVFRRAARDGGDRRHAPHPRPRARSAVLHPVPRAVFDADRRTGCSGSAWCSSASCSTRPSGLVGIWSKLQRRWRPPLEEAAAMNARRIHAGLPLPAFLRPAARLGTVLEVDAVSKHFGGIRAVANASLAITAGEVHALIGPNGAGKTTMFNLVSGMFSAGRRHGAPARRGDPRPAAAPDLRARPRTLVPDHQPVPRPVDPREPAPVAAGAGIPDASTPGATSTATRRSTRKPPAADRVPRPRRHRGDRGRRALLRRAAALGPRHRSRFEAAGAAARRAARGACGRRARARIEPGEERGRQHSGPDRGARHRSRARLLAARDGDEPGRSADGGHARRGAQGRQGAGGLHRNRHAARHRPRCARDCAIARRCCASRASTRSTGRATSSTMRRSTCARARSSRCSAATARASPRC